MNKKVQSKIFSKKRYILIFLCLIILTGNTINAQASAIVPSSISQIITQKKITLNMQNKSAKIILSEIEKRSGIQFMIKDEANAVSLKNLSINVKDVTVKEALDQLLKNTNYHYQIKDNIIMILKKGAQEAKKPLVRQTVKGRVTDKAQKKPLPGVMVLHKGTQSGAITDMNGDYVISYNHGDNSALVFSHTGFKEVEIRVGDKKSIDVSMDPDALEVDDVVVIGYGTRSKKELISSVSTITSEELKESTAASVMSLLQGKASGLEIINQTGSPGGGGNSIVIRGSTFLAQESSGKAHNGSPLYIVDGFPIHSDVSAVTGTDPLSMIDPATIESVEILKDAASASIYGSRAANGVILITTKKGKKGQSSFSASAIYAVSQLSESPLQSGGALERTYANNMMKNHLRANMGGMLGSGIYFDKRYPTSYEDAYNNSDKIIPNMGEYDEYWNQGLGADRPMLQDSLNPFYNNSSNWFREVFRIGKVLDAKVQSQGGSDKMQYMLSGGYYDEKGIMYSSNFSRVSLSSNISAQPSKYISINSQIALSYTDRSTGLDASRRPSEGYTVNPMSTQTLLPSDGVTKKALFEELNSITSRMDEYGLLAGLELKFHLLKGLDLSSSGSINFNQSNSNIYTPSTLDEKKHEGVSEGKVVRNIYFQNENLLSYKKTIATNHNIDLLAGMSLTKNQSYDINGFGKGNPSDNIHFYNGNGNSGGLITETSNGVSYARNLLNYRSSLTESAMISFFGRIAYNYRQKYLMEFTLRRDGSSTFGENCKYATFPSIALGWNIKEEGFMKSLWWLDMAKLRGSWGTSGQIFRSAYLAHGIVESSGVIDGRGGMVPKGMINKDLTWEKADQYDIGLDLTFMNYRVEAKIDYYYRYTSSLLTEVELPGNFYFAVKQDRNAAEISNEGIEFEIDVDILRETAVKWKMGFNISRNWNKLVKSYDGLDIDKLVIGRPLSTLEAYVSDGMYQYDSEVPVYYNEAGYPEKLSSGRSNDEYYTAGQNRIKDVNGDGYITEKDMVYIGSPLPKAHGGWTNNLKWRGLTLDLNFYYSLGRKIAPQYLFSSLNRKSGPFFNDVRDVAFWEKPGDVNVYPENHGFTSLVGGFKVIDTNVKSVNYLKLKRLTLGYNLPKKLLDKIKLSDVRFYITLENLFTLTNYDGMDPELVNVRTGLDNLDKYPLARKYTFGINVKF